MLILSLKAQTNHFHHMDQEFRGEFKKIGQEFENIDKRFIHLEEKFDKRFEQVDKKFDRLTTVMMWQAGIVTTLLTGLYLKLFLA